MHAITKTGLQREEFEAEAKGKNMGTARVPGIDVGGEARTVAKQLVPVRVLR